MQKKDEVPPDDFSDKKLDAQKTLPKVHEKKMTIQEENSVILETKGVSPWTIMQKILELSRGKPLMDEKTPSLMESPEKSVVPKYTGKIPHVRHQFIIYLPATWLACTQGTTKRIPFLLDTGAEVNVIDHRLVPAEFAKPTREAKKVMGAGGKVLAGGDREVSMRILLDGHTQKEERLAAQVCAEFYVMDIGRQPFAGILSCEWMENHPGTFGCSQKVYDFPCRMV